jgi:hypothetical protein
MEEVDHLEEDILQVPGQKYALISIVSPNSKQRHDACALKIRGVFATEEEGRKHAEKLSKLDQMFDVFLVDMYKWLPVPPDQDHIGDTVYQDKMLNEIIQGHKEQQMLVRQHFEEQKLNAMNTPPPTPVLQVENIPGPDTNNGTNNGTLTFPETGGSERELL